MKKFILILLSLALISGCSGVVTKNYLNQRFNDYATKQYIEDRLKDFKARIDSEGYVTVPEVKELLSQLKSTQAIPPEMLEKLMALLEETGANKIRAFTANSGGASGALDAISVASLVDGDLGLVFDISSSIMEFYKFVDAATDAEVDPYFIRPDDFSVDGVWYLMSGFVFSGQATPAVSLKDSDQANQTIASFSANATDANDSVAQLSVEEDTVNTPYIELDGVNEKVTFNKPLDLGTSLSASVGTVELGHATDTTLSRSASARLAVEGVDVALKDADQGIWQAIGVSVARMIADGTNCLDPDSEVINSGPNAWFSTCSDAAGTLEISIPMPENWDGGNIYVEIIAGSNQASPSGTVEFEVQAMARGAGDVINSTWLSTVNAQFADTIDTQYSVETAESAVIACSGAGGDMLYIKITRDNDDPSNDTSTQEVEVWGVRVYYQIDDMDERD